MHVLTNNMQSVILPIFRRICHVAESNIGSLVQDLLLKFKDYSRAVRPAVRKLIDEADAYAKSGEGRVPFGELFGTEG